MNCISWNENEETEINNVPYDHSLRRFGRKIKISASD